MPNALVRFVDWYRNYTHLDTRKKLPPGLEVQYHPRSPRPGQALGRFIVEDLLDACPVLAEQAARGEVVCGIDFPVFWEGGKRKFLDIAIGIPDTPMGAPLGSRIHVLRSPRLKKDATAMPPGYVGLSRLLVACEEKAVMTEHGKSEPRVWSELNDAHAIPRKGDRYTISAGIASINIGSSFVSPTRQRRDQPVEVTRHNQPKVAHDMVTHLRRLPIRDSPNGIGFDAYCNFVVDGDNQGNWKLHTAPPAPQPGDHDEYGVFLSRIAKHYTDRFSDLTSIPEASGLSTEEALERLAAAHPGLLTAAADLAVRSSLEGAHELRAILVTLEPPPSPPDDEGPEDEEAEEL